ncbi:MAG: DUF3244 domain-containing protein [Parabacteroides sp.]|nr:DUF3244 domain-containing protein [Parabacteroides sp.]
MKNKTLLIIILSIFTVLSCFAKKKIDIEAKWGSPSTRSISDNPPIQAWIEDNNKDILLNFSSFLGEINIYVTNGNGEIIYSQKIIATENSSFLINLYKTIDYEDTLTITNGSYTMYGNL